MRRFFWNLCKPSGSRGGEYGSLGGEYRGILRPREEEVRVKDRGSAALPGLHVLDRSIWNCWWSSTSHGSTSLLEYLTGGKSSLSTGGSCWNS